MRGFYRGKNVQNVFHYPYLLRCGDLHMGAGGGVNNMCRIYCNSMVGLKDLNLNYS